jgi:hypothetical protein
MRFTRRQRRQDSRKFDPKDRAAHLTVVAENLAAVFLNNAKANTQA